MIENNFYTLLKNHQQH